LLLSLFQAAEERWTAARLTGCLGRVRSHNVRLLGERMAQGRSAVLVTGGSRGIGAAIAQLAARRGCDVAVNYRSEREAAERVVTRCREAGANALACQG